MPHKICPECKKPHGPRKLVCECGYAFVKTSKADTSEMMGVKPKKPKFRLVGGPVKPKPPEPEPELEDIDDFKTTHYSRIHYILTPAGYPPAKPEGYGGTCNKPCYRCDNPWPNGQPTDKQIVEWATKIYDIGIKNGEVYALSAVIYYARHFWEYNTPEYRHVKEVLEECGNRP